MLPWEVDKYDKQRIIKLHSEIQLTLQAINAYFWGQALNNLRNDKL